MCAGFRVATFAMWKNGTGDEAPLQPRRGWGNGERVLF